MRPHRTFLAIGDCPVTIEDEIGYDHAHQEEFLSDSRVVLDDGTDITDRLSKKGWEYIEKRGVKVPERKAVAA